MDTVPPGRIEWGAVRYFMNRLNRFVIYSTLLILVLLSSCNSLSPVAELPVIVHQAADLTITLKPLDRDTLTDRHMSNRRRWQNPYIDFPGQIPRRRVIVFEADFETVESTVNFNLFEQNLSIESASGRAQTSLFMFRIWEVYLDDVGRNIMRQTLNATVLPKDFTVSPGNPVSGYLVFADSYPVEGGRGMLTMSATTPGGDRGTFEISVDFLGPDGAVSTVGDNTGVFAEEGEETSE